VSTWVIWRSSPGCCSTAMTSFVYAPEQVTLRYPAEVAPLVAIGIVSPGRVTNRDGPVRERRHFETEGGSPGCTGPPPPSAGSSGIPSPEE